MKIEEFKVSVEDYLLNEDANKERVIGEIKIDTNIWDAGLVDSFRIMELILFLEDLLGKEISVESNYLSNFYTIEKMHAFLVCKN